MPHANSRQRLDFFFLVLYLSLTGIKPAIPNTAFPFNQEKLVKKEEASVLELECCRCESKIS